MSGRESYSSHIRPIDTAAEWFFKGANIALYFALCLAPVDKPRLGAPLLRYAGTLAGYTLGQMMTVGGTIGTMFFVSTSLWHARGVNDGLNYALGGAAAVLVWHKLWEVPRGNLMASCAWVGVVMGLVGHYVIKDRYVD